MTEPSYDSKFVTASEGARITGFSRNTICQWAMNGRVQARQNTTGRNPMWEVSIESLWDTIDGIKAQYLPERPIEPENKPLPVHRLDPDIDKCMNEVQLAAHRALMATEDVIECPRGGRMRLPSCQDYVRKHFGLERTLGCMVRKCEHYKKPARRPVQETSPMLSPGPLSWDAHADMRSFEHQRPQLFAAKETRDLKPTVPTKLDKAKKKLSAAYEARHAARKAQMAEAAKNRDANIAKAKKMRDGSKTYEDIAKHFKVARVTVQRWINGREDDPRRAKNTG